jgi:hypothetical protein
LSPIFYSYSFHSLMYQLNHWPYSMNWYIIAYLAISLLMPSTLPKVVSTEVMSLHHFPRKGLSQKEDVPERRYNVATVHLEWCLHVIQNHLYTRHRFSLPLTWW